MVVIEDLEGNESIITMQQEDEEIKVKLKSKFVLCKFVNEFIFRREGNEDLFDLFGKAFQDYLNLFKDNRLYNKYPDLKRGSYIYKNQYIPPITVKHTNMNMRGINYSSPLLICNSIGNPYSFGLANYDNDYFRLVFHGYHENTKELEFMMNQSMEIEEIYDIYSKLISSLEDSKEATKTYKIKWH